ncbi:hypothetical protein [Legionella clemsonensis]|uniref:Glycosyltransferase RgtA/B/C/D-like domain-containing protein n=1 Tax=Legionella clemsonensis TaxID=1867846 RepID=A0A222P2H2_9GAMM|nr:hypothetical protein [Legionella clemsonensis]ASQ46042.1 hypothetical protein clem_07445 [Legionella clemsonensis]
MNLNSTKLYYYLIPSLLLVATIFIEWQLILAINHSFFSYSLDDPYIHLSLAKHIGIGEYGVNKGEVSSPSSSILWPFLLAPFSFFSFFEFVPLILNSLFSGLILIVFISVCLSVETDQSKVHWKNVVLFCLLIPSLNLIGLIFSGMEHSLQMLLSVLIMAGLIEESRTQRYSKWLALVIVLAPLVRYETLAIAVPALIFLFYRGHRSETLITSVIMLSLLGLFSLFLYYIGQPPLTASILLKIDFGHNVSLGEKLFDGFSLNLTQRQALIFLILAFGLIVIIAFSQWAAVKKQLLIVATSALILHLVLGRFNWFHRYEVYLYAAVLLLIFYLYFANYHQLKNPILWYIIFIGGLIFGSYPYFTVLASLPKATNNIYHQQFQMRRFVLEWLKGPVAVNDIGWISFNNPYYVLDLWGLGNYENYRKRRNRKDPLWMDEAVKKSGIKLVMLYNNWFDTLPRNWVLLGCLSFSGARVSAANTTVYFYATEQNYAPELKQKISFFINTLPQEDKFKFNCK